MILNSLEVSYLGKKYSWIHNLGYTENVPSLFKMKKILIENGWEVNEETEKKEDQERNGVKTIGYNRYLRFTKNFKGSQKQIEVIHSNKSSGIHLWFADPETGASGDGDPQSFLSRQEELREKEIIL